MTIRRGCCFLMMTFFQLTSVFSQPVEAIEIGDAVPPVELMHVVNSPKENLRLTDFGGKLLIIDFWGIGCATCIRNIPKMEELQARFGDELQVLLVNVIDSKERLSAIGFPGNTRIPNLNRTNLPIVYGQAELGDLFPHINEPYYVWVGKDGKVIGKTGFFSISESRVREYLDNGAVELPTALSLRELSLDENSSVLKADNNKFLPNILLSSVISKNISMGGWSSAIVNESNGIVGFRRFGTAVELLLKSLLEQQEGTTDSVFNFYYPDKLLFNGNASRKLIPPPKKDLDKYSQWVDSNEVYYELKLPNTFRNYDSKFFAKLFQEDLQRYLLVEASWEYRDLPCYVIRSTGSQVSCISKGDNRRYDSAEGKITVNNMEFGLVLNYLKKSIAFSGIPVLNETAFRSHQLVDISLTADLNDLMKLNQELEKFGLTVVQDYRSINVLTISDYFSH